MPEMPRPVRSLSRYDLRGPFRDVGTQGRTVFDRPRVRSQQAQVSLGRVTTAGRAPGGRRPRPAPWPGCTAGRLPAGSRDRPCRLRRRSRCGQLRSRRPGHREGRGSGLVGRPGEVPCAGPGPSPTRPATRRRRLPVPTHDNPTGPRAGRTAPPTTSLCPDARARPMTAGHNGEHLERLRDSRRATLLTPPDPPATEVAPTIPSPRGFTMPESPRRNLEGFRCAPQPSPGKSTAGPPAATGSRSRVMSVRALL